MASNSFPSVINDFNVYRDGRKLIGITGEVQLPELSQKSTTINGAGILGDFEEAVLGQLNNMSVTIPFRTLSEDIFSIMNPLDAVDITLRGAIQASDLTTGAVVFRGMRVVFRGRFASFTPGNVQSGEQMGSSVTLNLTYLLIEMDGKKMVEIDKFNGPFTVDGKDLLAAQRAFI